MFKRFLLLGFAGTLLLAACSKPADTVEVEALPVVTSPESIKIPENFGWEKIAGNDQTTTYIDTKNVEKTDGHTLVWSRVEHHKLLQIGPYKNIHDELQYLALDCGNKSVTLTLWVAMDKDGKEINRRSMNVKNGMETVANPVVEHMCPRR